ncbi:2,3-bisphosphoglycerate-independent phosphoglycerate mutase [bacterium]|jgi:2,3-bisphosphoglycerate-independent phosphoglycerate mutase|nr:2,3-bisphosphoglycerate-independent phosphoglycerate mutase [bacterium]MBT4251327.1 2,3-bisphosphoglycerate-independent phosphoglycerate mutase [bacterium]MBT4598292.1 2,3-bisphosphoglycerate-independent phosphoglycerate mutase [bacterium]MBT6754125.1 2,3-bisphosphoglycerate-independent phosphoglycerate mutase [bacterium]MBT7037945.1 2,3-bisphosphoglycerate-independent phosphoglycerate mutase [bacterium]
MARKKPVTLVILDGWGEWSNPQGNPVPISNLPTIDKLNKYYPKTLLQASGMSVGLPWGIYGNSEVGHQTIGTGQIIYQFLPVITAAIENGKFFENETLLKAVAWTKEHNSSLHLMGMISNGAVHSHIDHLNALLEFASEQKLENVYIHGITDGRDTPPKAAIDFINKIQNRTEALGVGKIASLIGRYFTMDRNKNWDRVEKGFRLMTEGEGTKETDPVAAIEKQYKENTTDEYIKPIVITDSSGEPIGGIKDNDAVVFFNFRKDRARQITQAFEQPNFDRFKESKKLNNVMFCCFSEYEKGLCSNIAFPSQEITTRLGQIFEENKLSQLRIAETEKFAHVTYFFNGGAEKPYKGEDRIPVLSKNVPSYADVPEMSALEVTDKLIDVLKDKEKDYDFILVNYANPDMVGHTGDIGAAVTALEITDKCLDRLITTVIEQNGCLLITADHGNVEEMTNLRTGERDTEHSTNPVPCWYITATNHRDEALEEIKNHPIEGMLVDLTPTILELMEIPKGPEMSGQSLLEILNVNR